MRRAVAPLLAAVALAGMAKHGPAQTATYRLSPESRFDVVTGKAGLLGGFGHAHRIRAREFTGSIHYDPADATASSMTLSIPAARLFVVPLGADREDAPEIEAAMREDVLHVGRWPTIVFRSTAVEAIPGGIRVRGELTLAGTTREVGADMRLRREGARLVADGAFSIRQSDWGIEPYSAALGTIRVADRVTFELHVVAIREGA